MNGMDAITQNPADLSGEQTLLGILQRLRDLQTQPMVPNNPMAQLGTVLQGFAAGTQGRANPALEMYGGMRAQALKGLGEDAQIGGALATLTNQRATRKQAVQDLTLKLAKDLENSDSLEERVQSVRLKQTLKNPMTGEPLLSPGLDPLRVASMKGKEYDEKREQVFSLVMGGEDPSAPQWATMFDPAIFGEQIQKAKMTAATGGLAAVNRLRARPEPPASVMTIDALRIEGITPKARSEADQQKLEVYHRYLKVDTPGTNTALALAKARKARDMAAGVPPKDDAAYIEQAFRDTDRSESFERDLETEASRLGLKDEARFTWKDEKRVAYQKKITEMKVGAQPIPAEHATPIIALRDGGRMVATLMSEFSPTERAKYAGWFNFKGRQAAQLVAQDPKFARFKAVIARGKNMAFGEGGKQLTPMEASVVFGWVPTGDEITATDFEEKLKVAWNRVETVLEDRISMATNPRAIIKEALTPLPSTTPQGRGFEYQVQPDGSVRVIPKGTP